MSHVYLDNRLLAASEANVSVFDRGFAYGDALFETIKLLKSRPVFFDEHMERLKAGAAAAGFAKDIDAGQLRNQALDLCQRNSVDSGRLRILVTRGTPPVPGGPDPEGDLDPTVLVTVENTTGWPRERYEKGVPCISVPANRGRYAGIKSAGLLGSILARKEAQAAGAWEAIFTNGHSRLLEGAYSNIFFLAENLLVTAPESYPILPGVIRKKIIEAALGQGLAIDYHAPKLEELGAGATSCFLTSSLVGICPVSSIDGIRMQSDPGTIAVLAERLAAMEADSAGF